MQTYPLGAYFFNGGQLHDCYHQLMHKKPLIDTNPYLRDPAKFRKSLITCVSSSSAVETGGSVESIAYKLEEQSSDDLFRTTQAIQHASPNSYSPKTDH